MATVQVTALAGIPGFVLANDLNAHEQYTLSTTQLMPIASLPARFKRDQFDRYAPAIGAALTAYPSAVSVPAEKYSVETIARCLREGIAAKRQFGYKHPAVDDALFARYAVELKTSMREGHVLLGPREAIQPLAAAATVISLSPTGTAPHSAEFTEVENSPDTIERICWLLSHKAVNPPPSFVVRLTGTAEEVQKLIDSYEVRYEVVFSQAKNDGGLYYII